MQNSKVIRLLFLVILTSCNSQKSIPSAKELETIFYGNEWAFDSICHILLRSKYGEHFPYREDEFELMPKEEVRWERVRYLSVQDKEIMDSLYHIVGCEVIYFRGTEYAKETHQNLQNRDVRFVYCSGGWFGNGIHKSIVYMPKFPPFAKLVKCDIDSLINYEYENGNEKLYSYYKRIKENWYINVSAYH